MSFNTMLIPVAYGQQIDQSYADPVALCNSAKGKLILLTVIDDLEQVEGTVEVTNSLALLEWVKEQQHKRLEDIGKSLQSSYPQLQIACEVLVGRSLHQITRAAVRNKVDFIVLGANQRNTPENLAFGSTTRHLMRKSPIPVWTLNPPHGEKPKQVAVAIDVAAADEQEQALNAQLVANAAIIARQWDCQLHVLHCWTLYGESYLRHWQQTDELKIANMALDEKNRRRALCQALCDATDGAEGAIIHLVHGKAADEIPNQIEQLDIDLLVMGTVCRTGIAGLFIGNTAENILNAIHCSVVTFKPEEFNSPLLEGTP